QQLQQELEELRGDKQSIKWVADKALEAAQAAGSSAVMRAIITRSSTLKEGAAGTDPAMAQLLQKKRINLLYLVNTILTIINSPDLSCASAPAIKELPAKVASAFKSLVLGSVPVASEFHKA
ncbi:hypothetical protein HaLaN_04003, partial [Haematococcus lacustris]